MSSKCWFWQTEIRPFLQNLLSDRNMSKIETDWLRSSFWGSNRETVYVVSKFPAFPARPLQNIATFLAQNHINGHMPDWKSLWATTREGTDSKTGTLKTTVLTHTKTILKNHPLWPSPVNNTVDGWDTLYQSASEHFVVSEAGKIVEKYIKDQIMMCQRYRVHDAGGILTETCQHTHSTTQLCVA